MFRPFVAIIFSIIKDTLNRISLKISSWAGSANAFAVAILVVIAWLVSGPIYSFSDTWLLAITVITDVIIFLMVFSIQNTQNRDSKAIRLKLNELIIANKSARDTFIGLETLTDSELEVIDSEFKELLANKDENHALHKLHAKISEEKAHRPSFSEQAGHFVETILEPFNGNHDDQK